MTSRDDKRLKERDGQEAGAAEHEGCPQASGNTPFVHRFATDEGKYIYDTNTMCIVPVDETSWEIILDIGELTKEEVIAKYADRFTPEKVAQAHDRIIEQQREGYFLARRPKVELTLSEEQVRSKLLTERQILILNVTEKCNFRCKYCSYDGHHEGRPCHSDKEMDWLVARRAIDEFLPHAVSNPSITFYGGEPLLHLALIKECVAYAHKIKGDRQVHFGLTTNASLLTGEVAEYLVSEDFSIGISLDGPREIHDRYRRTADDRPTWDRVAQNIREFRARYPRYAPHMLFMVTLAPPLDLEELDVFFRTTDLLPRGVSLQISSADLRGVPEDMIGKGRIQGYDKMRRRFLESLGSGDVNGDSRDRRHLLARRLFEKDLLRFHKRFGFGESRHIHRYFADTYCALSTCVPGVRRTFVATEGGYWPCERVPQSEYLRIGRVHEGLDIPKIHRVLREWVDMTKDLCPTCWCLRECGIGCPAIINDGDRPTREQKRSYCARHRTDKHALLVDYCSVLEKNPTNFAYMDEITIS